MRYELVIFDLDGTTLNTIDDLTDALNIALRTFGMPERTKTEVLSFVGNGIRKMVERAVAAGTDEETADSVCALFRENYGTHCMDKTVPYAGIPELLRELKENGVRTAISSNKDERLVERMCDKLLNGCVDTVVGSGGRYPRKPDPAGTLSILEKWNVPKDRVLYVGDSAVDVKTAENAGLQGVFVSWGFVGKEKLIPLGIPVVDTVNDLRSYILGECGYTVRRAENKDIPAILALLAQVLAVHHRARPDLFKADGAKYTTAQLEELIRDGNRPVFVCCRPDGTVCGHCFTEWMQENETDAKYARRQLYIDDLCVDARERRKGVGETLYGFVRNYAIEEGADDLTLHVWEGNTSAIGFYGRMGMRVRYYCMDEKLKD